MHSAGFLKKKKNKFRSEFYGLCTGSYRFYRFSPVFQYKENIITIIVHHTTKLGLCQVLIYNNKAQR